MSPAFSWTAKKINPKPQPFKKCCIVCFKAVSEERYEKFNKKCEECVDKDVKVEMLEDK